TLVVAAVGAGLVWSRWLALAGLYPLGALLGYLIQSGAADEEPQQPAASGDDHHYPVATGAAGTAAVLAAAALWRRRHREADSR
ncbi:MAG TPA: hypothetical protein VGF84_08625, partial [Micromonosporaceae bacterium]